MATRNRTAASFVERHGLWTDEQARLAKAVAQQIKRDKLELVRFSFADQHGVLRGKTLVAADALGAMTSGVTMTTTLLAKDTAHKTVYPVFTAGGGFDMAEMQGGGDFVMVADPATFQVLPWAPHTGWLLCDIVFTNGKPVPFSTRQILRDALSRLAAQGLDFLAGLEVEFHLFKLENPRLSPEDATWPPRAPEVSLLNQGYQYLTETRFDQIDAAFEPIRRGVEALGMPLRSLEIELGPSQCEFTFRPQLGLAAADTMILFRAATKQIARRHGLLASFMCRPGLPNLFSSGWHLHQSLIRNAKAAQRLCRRSREGGLSDDRPQFSRRIVGACPRSCRVHDADGQRLQTLPAVYARARSRDLGARQSRRAWSACSASRAIRRRIWKIASASLRPIPTSISPRKSIRGAMAWRIRRDPGPAADTPYETNAPLLPTESRRSACGAARRPRCSQRSSAIGFVDYYAHIKEAELARFMTEGGQGSDVTAWEQNEYFDLF